MKNEKDKYKDNEKEEESCRKKINEREFKKRRIIRREREE
jgi:hypothetical protein